MTECITTPASCPVPPTVAVLGAGIAGLTAAHELAERGFAVTVYEPRVDERTGLGTRPPGYFPPVKLGGLAASQYSTVGSSDGSPAELRPFPGRRGQPRPPEHAIAGEHGFRFFPAYYLHTWDLFQRIPQYEYVATPDGNATWQATSRTVMDNVKRVVTQGTTVEDQPSLVFPREAPRTPAEFLGVVDQLAKLGFTPVDIGTFLARILRYLNTSPLRRARELQNLSAYDYFVGRDSPGMGRRFSYSAKFDKYLVEMPRVLAAFDTRWGDARTNLTTYLQLQLQMDRRDNKADGVLNGPTTESWFDHWYRHLSAVGVEFVNAAVARIDPVDAGSQLPPHLRPRVRVTLTDGGTVTPDYVVVAVDAPAAEMITAPLRGAGTGGAAAGLDGYATSVPPPEGPLEPNATRPTARRNPYAMDEMGRVPWDRFQTLAGIQYFFDTEFQIVRGHVYYSGTEWALSSINQHGMWESRPTLRRDGHVAVLSVDIGDFNTPSRHLVDAQGNGKAARDCTADEIAAEVWRQIVTALTSSAGSPPAALLPWPSWYALDQGLTMSGPGQGNGKPVLNATPYLVPIVGDWDNRPGREPWNPHDTSLREVRTDDARLEDLVQRNVWQACHGGYEVHNNAVVFAGTYNRTFTRMTSMESAGESARHAVNAILDHYVWVGSEGRDTRASTSLKWQFPFGFLDQGYSSPIRMPTPAGDYCYIFDIENREPAETRSLRFIDGVFCEKSLPHPLDVPGPSVPPASNGGTPVTMPYDYNMQMLAYLQAFRQLFEGSNLMAGLPGPNPACPTPMMPQMPAMPTMPVLPGMPTNPAMPSTPGGDYTQQLFAYLQAWRQHLEQTAEGGTPAIPPPVGGAPTNPSTDVTPVNSPTDGGTNQSNANGSGTQGDPTSGSPKSGPIPFQMAAGPKIPPPKTLMQRAFNDLGNQVPNTANAIEEERSNLRRAINEGGSRLNESLFSRARPAADRLAVPDQPVAERQIFDRSVARDVSNAQTGAPSVPDLMTPNNEMSRGGPKSSFQNADNGWGNLVIDNATAQELAAEVAGPTITGATAFPRHANQVGPQASGSR